MLRTSIAAASTAFIAALAPLGGADALDIHLEISGSATGFADPCLSSAGETCGDGTVFAGTSSGTAIYTTSTYTLTTPWSTNHARTGANDADNGAANTQMLAADPANAAAVHCDQLVSNGKDDWYLPAHNELGALKEALAGLYEESMKFQYFWSSTECQPDSCAETYAIAHYYSLRSDGSYSGGGAGSESKSNTHYVQCVRSD